MPQKRTGKRTSGKNRTNRVRGLSAQGRSRGRNRPEQDRDDR